MHLIKGIICHVIFTKKQRMEKVVVQANLAWPSSSAPSVQLVTMRETVFVILKSVFWRILPFMAKRWYNFNTHVSRPDRDDVGRGGPVVVVYPNLCPQRVEVDQGAVIQGGNLEADAVEFLRQNCTQFLLLSLLRLQYSYLFLWIPGCSISRTR